MILALGKKTKVPYKTTYGHLIEDLNTAWSARRKKGSVNCSVVDRYWIHTNKRVLDLIEKLGINKNRDTIKT